MGPPQTITKYINTTAAMILQKNRSLDIDLKTPSANYHAARSSLLNTEGYYMVTMLLIETPILVTLMMSNSICLPYDLDTQFLITI